MYELFFWKYEEGIYLNNHEVYENLLENKNIDGLEEIKVETILNRIQNVFASWQKVDNFSYKNTNGVGAFQIKVTQKSFQVNCFGTHGKTMNQICNIFDEFQLPLYDPQIPARYDEFND